MFLKIIPLCLILHATEDATLSTAYDSIPVAAQLYASDLVGHYNLDTDTTQELEIRDDGLWIEKTNAGSAIYRIIGVSPMLRLKRLSSDAVTNDFEVPENRIIKWQTSFVEKQPGNERAAYLEFNQLRYRKLYWIKYAPSYAALVSTPQANVFLNQKRLTPTTFLNSLELDRPAKDFDAKIEKALTLVLDGSMFQPTGVEDSQSRLGRVSADSLSDLISLLAKMKSVKGFKHLMREGLKIETTEMQSIIVCSALQGDGSASSEPQRTEEFVQFLAEDLGVETSVFQKSLNDCDLTDLEFVGQLMECRPDLQVPRK